MVYNVKMKKKKLRCLGLFCSLFLLITFGNVKADVVVNQVVDNSCNENDLCEVDLGETVATCPNDCHQGNINPALIQQGLVEENAIEVFDIEVSIVDGALIVSWKTNKPAVSTLVFEDGMGGTEGGYLDELYLTEHGVVIDNFDLVDNFGFKILSKNIYNNDIYEYIDSFRFILPDESEVTLSDDNKTILPTEGSDPSVKGVEVGVVKEDSKILKDGVVIFEDGEYVSDVEVNIPFSFGEWVKEYLLGMGGQRYIMGVWGGIVLLLIILFI